VSPCNLALWSRLALLPFGVAIPGLFQCRRDQLRKAFTDARIRPGEALRRGSRVCLRGDRGNDSRLIGINHHRFGSLAFGVEDPGKLGPEPMFSFAGGRGISASAANSSMSNAPPTQRKYPPQRNFGNDLSQRSRRPTGHLSQLSLVLTLVPKPDILARGLSSIDELRRVFSLSIRSYFVRMQLI
jgi:hypothetical protein